MNLKTIKNLDYADVRDIDPTVASNLLSDDTVTWIDVRGPDEYVGELSHIKPSALIPMDQVPQHLEKIPKTGYKIFICRSGARSAKTCQYLQGIGYTDCFNLAGGMIQWNKLQLPIEGK